MHQYRGGVLRKTVTEQGQVVVRKPGMMRWTYSGADHKVFVSDGRKMYSYLPADRQVYVSHGAAGRPRVDAGAVPRGQGQPRARLRGERGPACRPAPPPAARRSSSCRTRGDRDYDWLVIVVDERSLAWRMLVTGDRQGGESTFTFTNLKENRGVSDREFTFQIPRGVDVITDPAPRP